MKPRITVITLGVDDLDRAATFYRDGLGFPTEGIVGREFETEVGPTSREVSLKRGGSGGIASHCDPAFPRGSLRS